MRKLSESVWGDIRKKSLGQEERIESALDSLDVYGLCDYLKEHYNYLNDKSIYVEIWDKTPILHVCLFSSFSKAEYIYYGEGEDGKELVLRKNVIDMLNCIRKVKNRYSTTVYEDTIGICPKDGSPVTNEFFIEVLDFFIDIVYTKPYRKHVTKKIDESVWGDIRKKSLGQEERVEKDNIEGFYEYLLDTYERIGNEGFPHSIIYYESKNYIEIPVVYFPNGKKMTTTNGNRYCPVMSLFVMNLNDEKQGVRHSLMINYIKIGKAIINKLKERYYVEEISTFWASIAPNDPDEMVSREFVLQLIDFILDNTEPDKPMIRKK